MENRKKRLLFIGDSLIESFDWEARYPDCTIFNLGRAGETVEGLLSRIDLIIGKYPCPDFVFIMTGINNIALGYDDFLGSYGEICRKLHSAFPGARIFVHSLLPNLLSWIRQDTIRSVNKALRELAQGSGTECLDMYEKFLDEAGRPIAGYLLDDGVHLSELGYAVWAGVIEGVLSSHGGHSYDIMK